MQRNNDNPRWYTVADPVGPPRDWEPAGDIDNGYDPRLPEHAVRYLNETRPEDRTRPDDVERASTANISNAHLNEHGITREEAAFLGTVVKAMNRDLDGYDLTESMMQLKNQYDIDEEKLRDKGYLKRHTGASRRAYYSVTFDGQKACRVDKEHGYTIGDIGADTPHRVGIDLIKQYYETLPETQIVEISPKENGGELDVVVVNRDGNRAAIVEVEAGKVTADPDSDANIRSGIHNYDSVRKDYQDLVASTGDAVWVARNHEIVGAILRALTSGDENPVSIDKDVIERVEDGRMKLETLMKNHVNGEYDGIDDIVTFKQLRRVIRENRTADNAE
ncbi:hypothetical protein [Natronoglomus mannanivorans]|uniref:Uncharacterized protein n=1 Tax=Natronoglomus mannanivorans TaxID=2979990 RepID=A0AAP3E3Y6_9EURY|nr:hypothetical protein [Halobacteria archaeon AArc-xg1-1]